jgi:hypothetical protein
MGLSPSSSHGNGGSQPPTTRAQYGGNDVAINNGAAGDLTWNAFFGTDLFDRSTPSLPAALAAGIYAITAVVQPSAITVGGLYVATLEMDVAGDDASVAVPSAISTAAHGTPNVPVVCTYYLPLGGQVRVSVTNFDGSVARNFKLAQVNVQRVT